MDAAIAGVVIATIIIALLSSGIWIAFSLLVGSIIGMLLFSNAPVVLILSRSYWSSLHGFTLTSLPLFIWMGEILFRSRVADDIFRGLTPLLRRIPGGLIHVNILGSAVFASVSGSSAATVATVGKISIPELKALGYDDVKSVGSLACAGSLGLLIPPSIVMIVYGVTAKVSVVRLFMGGILPGLMVAFLLMSYVFVWAMLTPSKQPQRTPSLSMLNRVKTIFRLTPIFSLMVVVIGSIYMGYATPTEAATVGVFGSLLIAALSHSLTIQNFKEGVMAALRTSCMIAFIIGSASFLAELMGYTGIPRALASGIADLGLTLYPLLAMLTVLFLILGCFLDGISIVVLTSAIVIPMVQEVHIDLLWFGIYLVILIEIAQITPPVGINLFIMQSLVDKDIFYVARAALPFFCILLASVVILVAFPIIVTWLPSTMS